MPYQCNQCNMGFSRESFLKQHQEKHLSKQDWIWNCRICPQNFPSETRYVYIKFAKIVNYSIFYFSEIRGLWFMKCLSIFWIRKLTFHINKASKFNLFISEFWAKFIFHYNYHLCNSNIWYYPAHHSHHHGHHQAMHNSCEEHRQNQNQEKRM